MVLPSGDQSNPPATWKSPLLTWRASRFPAASRATGITQMWFILKLSSTTTASFFSFLAFSSASEGAMGLTKVIHFPSGDQANAPTELFTSESCSASPPSERISERLVFAGACPAPAEVRDVVKAIHLPSGDHCGLLHDFSPKVNWKEAEPSAWAMWMCVRISLFSPAITASLTVKATRRPSGETCTPPTPFVFICSSGVQLVGAPAWAA